MKNKTNPLEMSNIDMLKDIRKDTHEVAKICYDAFKKEASIATGRLMNVSYNTAIRAMRDSMRYNINLKK